MFVRIFSSIFPYSHSCLSIVNPVRHVLSTTSRRLRQVGTKTRRFRSCRWKRGSHSCGEDNILICRSHGVYQPRSTIYLPTTTFIGTNFLTRNNFNKSNASISPCPCLQRTQAFHLLRCMPTPPPHPTHQPKLTHTIGRRCPRKTKRPIRRLPPRPQNVFPPPTSRRNKTLRTSLHSPNGRCSRHCLPQAIPTLCRWSR
jgi:hypothetical protein